MGEESSILFDESTCLEIEKPDHTELQLSCNKGNRKELMKESINLQKDVANHPGLIRISSISYSNRTLCVRYEQLAIKLKDLIRSKSAENGAWSEDLLIAHFKRLLSALAQIHTLGPHGQISTRTVVVSRMANIDDFTLGIIYHGDLVRELRSRKTKADDIRELGMIFLRIALVQPRLPHTFHFNDDFQYKLMRNMQKNFYSTSFALFLLEMIVASNENSALGLLFSIENVRLCRDEIDYTTPKYEQNIKIHPVAVRQQQCIKCRSESSLIDLPCHTFCSRCLELHIKRSSLTVCNIKEFPCLIITCKGFVPPDTLYTTKWADNVTAELITLTSLQSANVECPKCQNNTSSIPMLSPAKKPYRAKCDNCKSNFCTFCYKNYILHNCKLFSFSSALKYIKKS